MCDGQVRRKVKLYLWCNLFMDLVYVLGCLPGSVYHQIIREVAGLIKA